MWGASLPSQRSMEQTLTGPAAKASIWASSTGPVFPCPLVRVDGKAGEVTLLSEPTAESISEPTG